MKDEAQQQQKQLKTAEENEIILDLQSATIPAIQWKVKNGSTVRTGEILAQYSTTASTSNRNSKTATTIATSVAATAKSSDGINDANSNSTSNSNINSNNEKKKKMIRPKKRNRGMILKKITVTTTPLTQEQNPKQKQETTSSSSSLGSNSGSSSSTMQVEDVMKSFDHKSESISSTLDTSSSKISNVSSNEKWIPIKATMDGFVEIYTNTERRFLSIHENNDENVNGNNKKKTKITESKAVYVLGKIEPCLHPAVIDGLCAVCGQAVSSSGKKTNIRVPQSMSSSMYNNTNHNVSSNNSNSGLSSTLSSSSASQFTRTPMNSTNNNRSITQQSSKFTLSGGVTVSISQDYAQSISQKSSQSLRAARKLNLVLDLDHTLLHATADRRASKFMINGNGNDDKYNKNNNGKDKNDMHIVLLPLMEGHPLFENQQQKNSTVKVWQPHYVKLRRYLAEFICQVVDKFEITIYTAGTRTYANKIADVISRHVLDYQRRNKSCNAGSQSGSGENSKNKDEEGNDNDDDNLCCLDEGELNDLKNQVARLEERMRWDKSRRDRQEYVKRMNDKFESEKKKEGKDEVTSHDNNNDTKSISNIEKKESDDCSTEEKEHTGNNKKRRRVTFSDHLIAKDESIKNNDPDEKNSSAEAPPLKNDEKEVTDSASILSIMKAKLLAAEKREEAAQSLRKKIFGSRIITRTDLPDLGRDVKSLKRVFPCGGKMAAIVDDREDVWANADNNATGRSGEPPCNLLLVKPYHFTPFLNFADVNNSSGKDLSEERNKENKEKDDSGRIGEKQLLWTGDILQRLHGRFYDVKLSEVERDKLSVPSLLTRMRREVLSHRSKVILSGLVPLHQQNVDSSNERLPRHDVIRYAEELGAKVMSNVSNEITHVIAAKDGTNKILQARRIPGCAVVRISWLMECYWSITRRDVEPHYLGPPPIPRRQNAEGEFTKKLLLSGSDSEDDDEDDEDDDDDDDILIEFKRRMTELQSK